MTAAPLSNPREILIRDLEGGTKTVPLVKDRLTLGRSSANELCYPDDVGLSRQHLALILTDGEWTVEDMGSKNGTMLNGIRIEGSKPFTRGDRISAGHLTIEFADAKPSSQNTVMFVDNAEQFSQSATTVVASLDAVLAPKQDDFNKTQVMQGGGMQMQALINAGRELTGHRPLADLFPLILNLAVESVMAGRGVLMTVEGEELKVRAARGEGFKISSTVRDEVLAQKKSLLVRDAQLDQGLKEHMSIVEQKVRSMMAVPLQTNDRVIGLIYVDSPNALREFGREDLNLLTVMANIAATRIETARLNEVEEAERAMAKDMHQAALIQQRLLPSSAPKSAGLEIAGKTVASRQVGGDYYDFIPFPDGRIGMMVGDVAGKGMPAALLMSSLQARVHVLFDEPDELAAKMTRLNRTTCQNCPDNRFITFFACVIDPPTGRVVYANAGHNPPLVVRAAGGYDALPGGGVILGIMASAKYQEYEASLGSGDTLILFSDGVTEAPNPHDEEFGEERLANLVAELRNRPVGEIVDEIHKAVHIFTEGAPAADDITVVVARKA